MIIYGSRSKQLAKEILIDKCQHCGSQNSIDMHVFQKYAHVFWIPFFPVGKTGVSQCDHCKQVLKLNEMPSSLRDSYDNLKKQAKTPVWMYAGLALIAVIIIVSIINGKEKDAKNAKLILAPQRGDVFEIKTKSNQYTLYKVDEVRGDSVFVLMNNFESNMSSGLSELKGKGDVSYTTDMVLPLTKAELKQMLDKGEIMDIDRK
jgi:zinc-ribbon family